MPRWLSSDSGLVFDPVVFTVSADMPARDREPGWWMCSGGDDAASSNVFCSVMVSLSPCGVVGDCGSGIAGSAPDGWGIEAGTRDVKSGATTIFGDMDAAPSIGCCSICSSG
jgi:hypothetical protein